MTKALGGRGEELLLRRPQHPRAGVLEFLEKIRAAFLEQPFLFLESGALGAEGRIFLARPVERLSQIVRPRRAFRHGRQLRRHARKPLGMLLYLGLASLRRGVGLAMPSAPVRNRARAEKPPQRRPNQ